MSFSVTILCKGEWSYERGSESKKWTGYHCLYYGGFSKKLTRNTVNFEECKGGSERRFEGGGGLAEKFLCNQGKIGRVVEAFERVAHGGIGREHVGRVAFQEEAIFW